ncbi:MAG: hypothetical protein LBQ24_05735 [Candidatus Peribacteria bacterium]|nr:hypothetical protein [Candidatus Peribacteria bacterium]
MLVASHSIFGFVAKIISTFWSESSILLKSSLNFKSQINTQFTGEIAHQST